MATLFGRERSVIPKHLGNVFRTGELSREATCAKFAQVRSEGYRSREEKAAHLLYFLVKDLSFTDGNKRIASLPSFSIWRRKRWRTN